MRLELSELRDQAGETLQRAAAWLRVSVSHLSNCERGVARLTNEEEASLRGFYFARIKERLARLVDDLAAGDGGSEQ